MDGIELRVPASHGMWTLDVVTSTGSTNADLLARAAAEPGGAEGRVLVAEEQTAGRGRRGRTWSSVPGESLTFSALLRPASVPPDRRGWLSLLTGVAVASAVGTLAGVHTVLKWPNDVLAGDRKLAGILAEQSPDGSAVVVGVGLNVATRASALPVAATGLAATSLAVEAGGAATSREDLLLGILDQLERWYVGFRSDPEPENSGLLAEYRALCGTLGRPVRVELPAGRVLTGTAVDVDSDGRLLVQEPTPGALVVPVSAGDVIHVR